MWVQSLNFKSSYHCPLAIANHPDTIDNKMTVVGSLEKGRFIFCRHCFVKIFDKDELEGILS